MCPKYLTKGSISNRCPDDLVAGVRTQRTHHWVGSVQGVNSGDDSLLESAESASSTAAMNMSPVKSPARFRCSCNVAPGVVPAQTTSTK